MKITLNDFLIFNDIPYNHFYIDYNGLTESDTVIYNFGTFNLILSESYKAPKRFNLVFKNDAAVKSIVVDNLDVDLLVLIELLSNEKGFNETIKELKHFHKDYSYTNIKRVAKELEEAQKCKAIPH